LVEFEEVIVPNHDSPNGSVVGFEKSTSSGFGHVFDSAYFIGNQYPQITNYSCVNVNGRNCQNVASLITCVHVFGESDG
jgi:hypothetical protein